MSQLALRAAIRDAIRTEYSLKDCQCMVMDADGQPPQSASPLFVAVHPGAWRRASQWKGGPLFDEELGFRVTVSVQNSGVQPQNYGEWYLQNAVPLGTCGAGLESFCRAIAVFLHDNDSIMCGLETATGNEGQYSGGVFFQDGGMAVERTADWWRSNPASKTSNPPIGLSQTMTFDGVRRTQLSGTAT
jgi:hypothetical protein